MPAKTERARPWKRAPSRPPIVGTIVIFWPSTLIFTFGGTGRESVPFGPVTSNLSPLTEALTPFGRSIGRLPVRERRRGSPVVGAAAVVAAAITTPHKGARRRRRASGTDGRT